MIDSQPRCELIPPSQLLLSEAAKAEQSQAASVERSSNGASLEKMLPAASAGCGRAASVLSENDRRLQESSPEPIRPIEHRCVTSHQAGYGHRQ